MKKLNTLIFKDQKNKVQSGLTQDEMQALWEESGFYSDPINYDVKIDEKENEDLVKMEEMGFCLAENTKDASEPYQCAHNGNCHQCRADLVAGNIDYEM